MRTLDDTQIQYHKCGFYMMPYTYKMFWFCFGCDRDISQKELVETE